MRHKHNAHEEQTGRVALAGVNLDLCPESQDLGSSCGRLRIAPQVDGAAETPPVKLNETQTQLCGKKINETQTQLRQSYRYRAYCNKQTAKNIHRWLWKCKQLYNITIAYREYQYKTNKTNISFYDCYKPLIGKKTVIGGLEWIGLDEIPAKVKQNVLDRVDKAYKNFFRRVKGGVKPFGYPKHKKFVDSFTLDITQTQGKDIPAGWKLDGNLLAVKNIGILKLRLHRPIVGRIKTVTVKRESDRFYVVFSCENVPTTPLPITGNRVGLDMGLTNFVTDSDGVLVDNPKYLGHIQKQLRVISRKLARCKRGSNRRKQVKKQLARLHLKVANKRKDYVYNVANEYAKDNDIICVEKLNIKEMTAGKGRLNRHIMDSAWGNFLFQLQHKCNIYHREFIAVNPKNTTQMCSNCGNIPEKKLTLRDRIYVCESCNFESGRDVNAAKNILVKGLGKLSEISGARDN